MTTMLDKWLKKKKPTRATPVKSMRLKCLDCMGNNQAEVRRCTAWSCPLWPYRMAKKGKPPPDWIHPDDDKLPEDIPEESDEDEEETVVDGES